MTMRFANLFLIACAAFAAGCKKSEPPPVAAPAPVPTIARLHWLGKKNLETDTNAVALIKIWDLPESAKLESELLGKLSAAPWTVLHRTADTNAGALLRPLFDDVLQQESCLEIRQPTNQPYQLVFAIHLDDARAALWETNLAAVLGSLTGIQPAPSAGNRPGWSLQKHEFPNLIELTYTNGWTIVGAAQDHNALLDDWLAAAQSNGRPFAAGATNNWLEANLDLQSVSNILAPGWNPPGGWPKISLETTGNGRIIETSGELNFPNPVPMDLEPWNIPTNLVDGKLSTFTAVRGIQSWLTTLESWNNLHIGPPPNQFCCWGVQSHPMLTYFSAPLPDASNIVYQLSSLVLEKGAPWFATHELTKFERAKTFNGLQWRGLPYLWPFLQSVVTNDEQFVYGGLGPPMEADHPLRTDLWHEIMARTNLVYYDWEIAGLRCEQWVYIAQYARFVSKKTQIPFKSNSQVWFKAVEPRLGSCLTEILRESDSRFSFVRQSSVGFTGVELQTLADWLESPDFPIGLNTFRGPPPAEDGITPQTPPEAPAPTPPAK